MSQCRFGIEDWAEQVQAWAVLKLPICGNYHIGPFVVSDGSDVNKRRFCMQPFWRGEPVGVKAMTDDLHGAYSTLFGQLSQVSGGRDSGVCRTEPVQHHAVAVSGGPGGLDPLLTPHGRWPEPRRNALVQPVQSVGVDPWRGSAGRLGEQSRR